MSTEIKLAKDNDADSVDSTKYRGTCIFTNESSFDLPNPTQEKHILYQNHIPNILEIKNNISIPQNDQTHSNSSIIRHNELLPNIKDWELILRENVICVDTYKNSIDACSAIMLCHLKTCQKFNLGYYIAHKIENVKNQVDCPLPYGLLLTRIYKNVLAKHPKLFRPHSKLQFILHYRMMNSINGKKGKKRAKDKEAKPTICYSPSSDESTNQSTPLLGSYQQELLANEWQFMN
ncbi:hypothetical protein Tco_0238294 [Tanacetum coccineum]